MIKKLFVIFIIALFISVSFKPVKTSEAANLNNIYYGADTGTTTNQNTDPADTDILCYGYVLEVNSNQDPDTENLISSLVNELLEDQIKVYRENQDFPIFSKRMGGANGSEQMNSFEKGSFIIPFTSNGNNNVKIINLCKSYRNSYGLNVIFEINGPSYNSAYELRSPRIAYHSGKGVSPYSYRNALSAGGFPSGDFLDWDDIPNMLNTNNYDVFIWGGSTSDVDYNINKWNSAVDKIKQFINNGGGYVGSCFGAYVASNGIIAPIDDISSYFERFFPDYFLGAVGSPTFHALPGHGSVEVTITDTNNPVAYGVQKTHTEYLYDGPVFTSSNVNAFSKYVGVDDQYFWWDENVPEQIRDIWKDYTYGRANAVTTQFGSGKVVAFGTHPESGIGQAGSLRFSLRLAHNSIFYVTSNGIKNINIDEGIIIDSTEVDANGPYTAYLSEEIDFIGEASFGTPPYQWEWDFGNDDISNEQNPAYCYSDTGVYPINLLVTDSCGVTQVAYTTATIFSDLEVTLSGHNYRNLNCDEETSLSIQIHGVGPYDITWDMGDNGNAIQDVLDVDYSYSEPGIYEGNVEVADDYGHIANCNFIVAVNNQNGPFRIACILLNPNIASTDENISMKTAVYLTDSVETSTIDYELYFGDGEKYTKNIQYTGQTDVTLETEHSYDLKGNYLLKGILSDENGNSYYYSANMIVNNILPDKPSTPSGPTEGKADEDLTYTSSATDSDGDKIRYIFWCDPIDDGSFFSFGQVPKNDEYEVYFESGETVSVKFSSSSFEKGVTYEITVVAIDEKGGESEWSEPLEIKISNKRSFLSVYADACLPLQINLDNSISPTTTFDMIPKTYNTNDYALSVDSQGVYTITKNDLTVQTNLKTSSEVKNYLNTNQADNQNQENSGQQNSEQENTETQTTNHKPEIQSISDQTVTEGNTLCIKITANDLDEDALEMDVYSGVGTISTQSYSYSFASSTQDSTQLIRYFIYNAQQDSDCQDEEKDVTIRVTDSQGSKDYESFTIFIQDDDDCNNDGGSSGSTPMLSYDLDEADIAQDQQEEKQIEIKIRFDGTESYVIQDTTTNVDAGEDKDDVSEDEITSLESEITESKEDYGSNEDFGSSGISISDQSEEQEEEESADSPNLLDDLLNDLSDAKSNTYFEQIIDKIKKYRAAVQEGSDQQLISEQNTQQTQKIAVKELDDVTLEWSFGDGTTTTGIQPTHTYTIIVEEEEDYEKEETESISKIEYDTLTREDSGNDGLVNTANDETESNTNIESEITNENEITEDQDQEIEEEIAQENNENIDTEIEDAASNENSDDNELTQEDTTKDEITDETQITQEDTIDSSTNMKDEESNNDEEKTIEEEIVEPQIIITKSQKIIVYQVTLTIKDSEGNILAQDQTSITINIPIESEEAENSDITNEEDSESDTNIEDDKILCDGIIEYAF